MANVTEAQMRVYLGTFHDTYSQTVEQYLAADVRANLLRRSLLPVRVLGYVSTQLGAGYEYFEGERRYRRVAEARASRSLVSRARAR